MEAYTTIDETNTFSEEKGNQCDLLGVKVKPTVATKEPLHKL
jgi:hypothetical protein